MKLWSSLMLLAGAAGLAFATTANAASIVGSKHDLNTLAGVSLADRQVCLPCHAPHNMPPANYGLTRLWNHTMPNNTYTLFSTDTTKYVGLDDVSRKCLSCHDGTVAVDNYGVAGGAYSNTGTTYMPVGYRVGEGQNLTHDHPVGVIYAGLSNDGATFTVGSGVRNKSPLSFSTSQYSAGNAQALNSSGTSTINTDLTNYVDTSGAALPGISKVSFGTLVSGGITYKNIVGCGSCHTPHNPDFKFLKIKNVNSQLCLTCHNK